MIDNDFFDSQAELSVTMAKCFQSWLKDHDINFIDFNVFGNTLLKTKCPLTFLDVMDPVRHPTEEEQKEFAKIFINWMTK